MALTANNRQAPFGTTGAGTHLISAALTPPCVFWRDVRQAIGPSYDFSPQELEAGDDAQYTTYALSWAPPEGTTFLNLYTLIPAGGIAFTTPPTIKAAGLLSAFASDPLALNNINDARALGKFTALDDAATQENGLWLPLCNLNTGAYTQTLPANIASKFSANGTYLTQHVTFHTFGLPRIIVVVTGAAVLSGTLTSTPPLLGFFGK